MKKLIENAVNVTMKMQKRDFDIDIYKCQVWKIYRSIGIWLHIRYKIVDDEIMQGVTI